MPWSISISEPVTDQIEEVVEDEFWPPLHVYVDCTVTTTDGNPPDIVRGYVYDEGETVDGTPPADAEDLSGGANPYNWTGHAPIPSGHECGITPATLSDLTLALWAGRSSGGGYAWHGLQIRNIKGCCEDLEYAKAAIAVTKRKIAKLKKATQKAKSAAKKATKKKRKKTTKKKKAAKKA